MLNTHLRNYVCQTTSLFIKQIPVSSFGYASNYSIQLSKVNTI